MNTTTSAERWQHLHRQSFPVPDTSRQQRILLQKVHSSPGDQSFGQQREPIVQHSERVERGSQSPEAWACQRSRNSSLCSGMTQFYTPLPTPAPEIGRSRHSAPAPSPFFQSYFLQQASGSASHTLLSQSTAHVSSNESGTPRTKHSAGYGVSACTLKRQERSKRISAAQFLKASSHRPLSHMKAAKEPPCGTTPACLSFLAREFTRGIKALENVRELFCANEYPESFSGEEAVKLLSDILDDISITEAELIQIANALLHNLFEPTRYAQASMIKNTVINSPDECYYFDDDAINAGVFPRGVIVKLTACYVQGCRPGIRCYAPRCPNRKDKHSHEQEEDYDKSTSDSALIRSLSVAEKEKLGEKDFRKLMWSEKMPTAFLKELGKRELARQEAINEIIYSEEVYLDDMETLHKLFYLPLLEPDIITNEERRNQVVADVFINHRELMDLSRSLFEDLLKIEKQYKGQCVNTIGDVLVRHFAHFEAPFTRFAERAYMAAHIFEYEIETNPTFAKYIEEIQSHEDMRRLTWRHFVLRPIVRMARYPLLINPIMEKTEPTHPDYPYLVRCKEVIEAVAKRSDELSEYSKQRVSLIKINDGLVFKPGEATDLHLLDPRRKLFFQDDVKRCANNNDTTPRGDLTVMVFDHVLVLTKKRKTASGDEYLLWKRPIPLQLIGIAENESMPSNPSSTISSPNSSCFNLLSVGISHYGTRGGYHNILCSDAKQKKELLEAIDQARNMIKNRHGGVEMYKLHTLDDCTFRTSRTGTSMPGDPGKVNCTVPFMSVQGKPMLAIGTEHGVYIKAKDGHARHIIGNQHVTRLAVMEQHGILVVLADRVLQSYPLDKLLSPTNMKTPDRLRQEIEKNVHFFQVGVCNGRVLLVYKKRKNTVSIFKSLEPVCNLRDPKNEKMLEQKSRLLGRTSHPWFRPYKDFYVGAESTNVHFLKSKLLVVCERGFEIIDPEDLRGSCDRDVPNRNDPQFAFLARYADGLKPLAMYRLQDTLLLCYNKFAFYVDRRGGLVKRPGSESPLLCEWEGIPTHVIVQGPYVIAFDNKFVEVRSVETGELEEVVLGDQIRLTYFGDDTSDIHCSVAVPSSEDECQVISQLQLYPPRHQAHRWSPLEPACPMKTDYPPRK